MNLISMFISLKTIVVSLLQENIYVLTQGDIYPELEIWLLNRLRAQLKYRKTKLIYFVFRNTFLGEST